MHLEWLAAAAVIAALSPLFGHFEAKSPLWTRIARWLIYLAILLVIDVTVGRPWTWIWVFALPLIGASFHFAWCRTHHINPITTEPRDRYYQLRGWQ
jgi:hypothetical protein